MGAAAGPPLPRRSQSPDSTLRPPRRSPHAATAVAAADDDARAARPRPRSPPPRRTRSHPQGEENARSHSLGVRLQHGFRLLRSSPPLTPAPPPSAPFSRLRPECAAAIPEGTLRGASRVRPRARSVSARRPGVGGWPGGARLRPRAPLQPSGARKDFPAPGSAGGTARKELLFASAFPNDKI